MITIVDYDMGNLGSITNMLKYIGVESEISKTSEQLKNAKKIILPGVGSFDKAVNQINESGCREILDEKALKEKIPILGICLGMQLLTEGSDEGKQSGLRWVQGKAYRFPKSENLKVPHMGWNLVHKSTESDLTSDLLPESRFYFVHSYYVKVKNEKNSILKTSYGLEFDSAIQNENIYGAQFHPEKSHKYGMQLLNSFVEI